MKTILLLGLCSAVFLLALPPLLACLVAGSMKASLFLGLYSAVFPLALLPILAC
jgi:hypothetical protein